MKRIVTALLVFLILAITTVGYCTSSNELMEEAMNLTTEELIELRDFINSELEFRGVNEAPIVSDLGGYSPWYDYGLGSRLPNPYEVIGREAPKKYPLARNSDELLRDQIYDVTDEEFDLYTSVCRNAGFNKNISTNIITFEADSSDSYHLQISNFGGTCIVRIDPIDK